MKTFTPEDFALVCKFLQLENKVAFAKMYDTIGLIGICYAITQYEYAKTNFFEWYCGLNADLKEKILLYVKEYYKA